MNLADAFGNILNSVANGYGEGLATKPISSGRQPGVEQYANPLLLPAGTSNQPGTTPTVSVPVASSSLVPGLSNTALFLGVGAVLILGVTLVALRK